MNPAVQRAALTKADEAVQARKWAYHAADDARQSNQSMRQRDAAEDLQ